MLSATSSARAHSSLLDDFEGIAPFINTAKALEMTKEPWARDGSDFSDRIWKSKQGLLGNLNKDIIQGVIRGDSYDKLTQKMAQELNASEHAAGRLLMTESTAFSTMAQKETFKGLDVEMIEIVETIDSHTCAECASMNGRIMKIKDVEAGVTAPPFHPWCRGCICPYVEDEVASNGVLTIGIDGSESPLSKEEIDAIKDWTEPECKYGCPEIRAYQQGRVQNPPQRLIDNEKNIEGLFGKVETYEGPLWRGITVPKEVAELFVPGFYADQLGTSSWSKLESVSKGYLLDGDGKVKVLFSVAKSHGGVDVSGISVHPEDCEVIHSKKKKFSIIESSNDGDIIMVDLLEE